MDTRSGDNYQKLSKQWKTVKPAVTEILVYFMRFIINEEVQIAMFLKSCYNIYMRV